MRKLLLGALLAAMLLASMPMVVAAESCCDYEVGCCCWRECCEKQVYWFSVSYFERVESGFYTPWGTPMYTGVWTTKYVQARNAEKAAEMLGFRAGRGCAVGRVLNYEPSLE